MGTDIHLAVEARRQGSWHRVLPPEWARDPWLVEQAAKYPDDSWYQSRTRTTWFDDRCYDAFAILADVRNGRGFAGIETGQGFVPISEPRGLPDDLSPEVARATDSDEADDVDLGEHSFSWLTLAELLAYDWNQTTTRYGVVTLEQFLACRAKGERPESYSGWISGPGIVVISQAEAEARLRPDGAIATAVDERTYVRMEWTWTYAEASGGLHSRLIPNLKRYADEQGLSPDDLRIVFGFDS